MKYRKKPVVIEAFKWMTDVVPQWWKDAKGIEIEVSSGCAFIPTLEGVMHRADAGDWIIQGVKGELYPCKPDIFAATYEPVETTRNVTCDFCHGTGTHLCPDVAEPITIRCTKKGCPYVAQDVTEGEKK
jgi:hypothetical protein